MIAAMTHDARTLPKPRLEALSDGIYAIALTLLVLELKLPGLPEGVGDAELRQALVRLLPKALTWLLSFWVMLTFWLAQLRIYRYSATLDWPMFRAELGQLALVSLLPFSTALMGEHGTLPTVAALYSAHLLLMSLLSWQRTAHLLARPELRSEAVTPQVARSLRRRAWLINGCTLLALLLAFVVPGWNMFAMLPAAFTQRIAPL